MTTPHALELLLWLHAHEGQSAAPPGLADPATAGAVADLLATFAFEGIALFRMPDRTIEIGERGRIWLTMILETPMPVSRWADPRGLDVPVRDDVKRPIYEHKRVEVPIYSATPVGPGDKFKGEIDLSPGTISPPANVDREASGIDPAVLERARNSLNGTKGGKFVPVPLPDDGTWASTAGHKRTGPPDDVPGNQFVQVFRRNGHVHQLYAASVNWKDRGKADDAIGFRLIDEPPNKIAVNNSPKSQGKAS